MKFDKIILFSIFFLSVFYTINCDFTLGILGDVGEINHFKANPTTPAFTENDGSIIFGNFIKVLNNNQYLCAAQSTVVLGDEVYTEAKNLGPSYPQTKKDDFALWTKRLNVGWAAFKKTIDDYIKTCPTGSAIQNVHSTSKKYKNLVLLAGNHLYDVDYEVEAKNLLGIVTNAGLFYDAKQKKFLNKEAMDAQDLWQSPRIEVQQIDKDNSVVFIDVNLLPVTCHLKKFENCKFKTEIYPKFPTPEDGALYTTALVAAFEYIIANKFTWKVIRLHHPFFNVEGKFNNMSDMWQTPVSGTKTFLDLVRESGISFILASHHHSAQVLAYPYERKIVGKYEGNNILTNPCFSNSNLIGLNKDLCKENPKDQDITIDIGIDAKTPNVLWTFVIGNSGRSLDPLSDDQNTPASLIWGSSLFGGANLVFSANKATLSYYLLKNNNHTKSLVINISNAGNGNYPNLDTKPKMKKRKNRRLRKK